MGARDVVSIVGLLGKLIGSMRDEEFERALADQNLDTEASLRYRLCDIEFVDHTRVTRLSFIKIRTYRTVERNIQRNYEKYKIYSNWKEKEIKIPAISLKLTNNVLENMRDAKYLLQNSIVKKDDAAYLVSRYAYEILSKLIVGSQKTHLMPSWMERDLINKEGVGKVDALKHENENIESAISAAQDSIHEHESQLAELKDKVQKIAKARENKLLFVLLSILTLGWYAYSNSGKRLDNLTAQLNVDEPNNAKEMARLNKEIEDNSAKIKDNNAEINIIKAEYKEKFKQIKPLTDYIANSEDFTPMRDLLGIDYVKIKGVYVIRNKELDKVYVGQSKDVLKRLKAHFTGTEPKNIIFAEDYYRSKLENKEELFEFKIEVLETKDELDKREMELISEYDSFNNGYNKTAGNI